MVLNQNLRPKTVVDFLVGTQSKYYEIFWPWEDETYIFNERGFHLETRSMVTDSTLVTFSYDSDDRLITVINKRKNTLEIKRSDDQILLEVNGGLHHVFRPTFFNKIGSIAFPSGRRISFEEDGNDILMIEDGKLVTLMNDETCINPVGLACKKLSQRYLKRKRHWFLMQHSRMHFSLTCVAFYRNFSFLRIKSIFFQISNVKPPAKEIKLEVSTISTSMARRG